MNLVVEFKKQAFLSEEEKFIENEKERERVSFVNFEMEKNNRFLNILSNKIPDNEINAIDMTNDIYIENYQNIDEKENDINVEK